MSKVMKTMDGNTAAAHVAYCFTEVAAIYPITPSSPMAESCDEWSANGVKNMFGQNVKVSELQSEAGAAGAVHGSLAAGALTTTFTASQGLLLMVPNMYKIAGELLPGVFHVSARALAAHALSIFGEHSDVYACRQTGFAMLATSNVQEITHLAPVAHLAAIKGRVPFLHFFDGFRTSHEVQKVEILDYDQMAGLVDQEALAEFRNRALNPENPVQRGTAQNPDIFFQAREACNKFYDALPEIVEEYINKINELTGRNYGLFDYYGAPDADRVIIAMGSVCDTISETVDYLNAQGQKVGLLNVHLYRPFSVKHFLAKLPKTATKLAVLDRTKEPGSIGDPLYLDVCTAYFEANERPLIVGGRYGLGSKDTTPAQIIAVYDNLAQETPKNHFTVGIVDDVTFTSLPVTAQADTSPEGMVSCKFWGLGADGTVGANKNSIKIIGDHTDKYVQAYFSYDSKKSGGITVSHLRFGDLPIRSTYLINNADFVACHNASYIGKYDMTSDLKPGGTFLLNCSYQGDQLGEHLTNKMKRDFAQKGVKLYTIDAVKIAGEIGLGGRINMVMQAAFFKLANIIPLEDAVDYMKTAIKKTYGRKGDKIVEMNWNAVDQGIEQLQQVQIPAEWAELPDDPTPASISDDKYVNDILIPVNAQIGDSVPVSAFVGREDGTFPQGTTKYEKRGIGIKVPEWIPENCIQCNQCSYVCPHAVIRPFLLTEEEAAAAPDSYLTLKANGKGFEDYKFTMQTSVLDCTGCGNCVDVCPSKKKALEMKPQDTQIHNVENWDYSLKLAPKANPANPYTVKGSQFEQPLFEFHGACAGCGETAYIKLITQLFGDRMMIANATGCSSIYGGSAPVSPFTTNALGRGPSWANSLFEDNAEYGYGMALGVSQLRDKVVELCNSALESGASEELSVAIKEYLEKGNNGATTRQVSDNLLTALQNSLATASQELSGIIQKLLSYKDHFVKKSQWIIGGDGWAYDIGFGGLDHVLASGRDVNILVLDTEVYSNTGGQSSKASQTGSVAQFAASGKETSKKDLGLMMTTYGYVYVAQIAMGANQAQTIKAITEAENYNGPSVVIAYSPCINHGISKGMAFTQLEQKKAVECGYWHLYRYNPLLKEEGKNPFILDSKEPTASYNDFVMGETRYSSLVRTFPDRAETLFKQAEVHAKERYDRYKKMSQ